MKCVPVSHLLPRPFVHIFSKPIKRSTSYYYGNARHCGARLGRRCQLNCVLREVVSAIDRTGVRKSFCRENSRQNDKRYGILREYTSPRTISAVVRVQVVCVSAVRTVAVMSGLEIVLDMPCACQGKKLTRVCKTKRAEPFNPPPPPSHSLSLSLSLSPFATFRS